MAHVYDVSNNNNNNNPICKAPECQKTSVAHTHTHTHTHINIATTDVAVFIEPRHASPVYAMDVSVHRKLVFYQYVYIHLLITDKQQLQ